MTPTKIARSLVFVLASVFAAQGCTAAAPLDAMCGNRCAAREICIVEPGCSGDTTYRCAPNTCADASILLFCGCDGQTFSNPEGACAPRTRRYRAVGPCLDAGVSVDANSGG